jgi:hypothetical protein
MTKLTRRELVLAFGAGALAGTTLASTRRPSVHPGVVGVAEARAELGKALGQETARLAMAGALAASVGAASGVEAAAALFSPRDVVGIKVSCLAGKNLSPRVELVEALVNLIAETGVDRRNIVVFERSNRELQRAGFEIRESGPPYRMVSTTCSALVSFGVVKDHDLSGVSAGMKNWYGVIHNPNKYHDNGCDPYIADVARHPYIRNKLRLTVLDGVIAQCHGGPAYRQGGIFKLGMVAASTDPVAADLWAWREIESERARRGMPTLEAAGRPVRFLATAAKAGLGVDDPERLSLVRA